MGEHYTLLTQEASSWCAKCKRTTMHRVDGRRLGPCLKCIERLDAESAERAKIPPPAKQDRLF